MGSENRRPTAAELERMKALVDADMRTGAWGLSLGLGYAPGVSSEQDELNELGSVVAKYDGIVTSHMRNQGAGTPESWKRCSTYTGTRSEGPYSPLQSVGQGQLGTGSGVRRMDP
jgi:N-acyl-D-amino-acid deacylase